MSEILEWMKICSNCKYYNNCEVILAIEKWSKERELRIDSTKAGWVISDMVCNLWVKEVKD